jgi:hypothetical protein
MSDQKKHPLNNNETLGDVQSTNVLKDVIKDLPREVTKRWAVNLATIGLLTIAGSLFGWKAINNIFREIGAEYSNVSIYAKLDQRVNPGDTVELYPPSMRQTVNNQMEAEWEVPFDQIANKSIEIQKIDVSSEGEAIRKILVKHPIGEKPVVAFMFRQH